MKWKTYFVEYSPSSIASTTSGEIQNGDPTKLLAGDLSEELPQSPK
jgi:hypothetical protein